MTVLVAYKTPDLLARCAEIRNMAVFGKLPEWARKALESGTRQDRAKAIEVVELMLSPFYRELNKFTRSAIDHGDSRFIAKAKDMLPALEAKALERQRLEGIEQQRRERERWRLSPEGQKELARMRALQEKKRRDRSERDRAYTLRMKGNNPQPSKANSQKRKKK